jgi:hypothetical protein
MIGTVSPWGRKRNTNGTREYRSPLDCTDTSQWRCHNYSRGRIIGPIPSDRPRSISRRSVWSLMLLEECACTSRQWSSKNGYKINTLGRSSLYVIFCGQMMHDSRVRLSSTSTSHLWPRVNAHALHERVYQIHFSVSFGLESSGTLQCYLTGWLLNDIVVLWRDAWSCAFYCVVEFLVSTWRSSSTPRERRQALVTHDISKKVDWTSMIDCVSSVAESNSDRRFPVEAPEGACLCSPSQD